MSGAVAACAHIQPMQNKFRESYATLWTGSLILQEVISKEGQPALVLPLAAFYHHKLFKSSKPSTSLPVSVNSLIAEQNGVKCSQVLDTDLTFSQKSSQKEEHTEKSCNGQLWPTEASQPLPLPSPCTSISTIKQKINMRAPLVNVEEEIYI